MKYVLLTGASGGLGLHLSEYLMNQGYYVIMLYNIHKDEVEELANKYKNGMIYKIDLTNDDEIIKLHDYLTQNNIRINILINNAAIDHTSDLEDKTKEDFINVFTMNTYVPYKLMQTIEYDTCVNISSENAIDTYDEVTVEYDVSKAGLNMLNNIFRRIHPNRIYNVIAFGWLDTKMNKIDEDIKKYIEFVPFGKACKEIEKLFDKQIEDIVIVRK